MKQKQYLFNLSKQSLKRNGDFVSINTWVYIAEKKSYWELHDNADI